jgi:hypothetical protein
MDEEEKFDKSLESAAKSMPQFDVPERLTQNIMAAVQAEPVPDNGRMPFSMLSGFAALAAALLVWTSFDTGIGWASWAVSVIVLWLFKLLFESGDAQEPLAQ